MLIRLRSLAFAMLANLWTWSLVFLYLPLLALPRQRLQWWAALWCRGVVWLARAVCGIRYRVVGRENLPSGPVLLAAKHQSEYDGVIFHLLLDDPVFVLKQELLRIPMFGLYLRALGNIGIDRSAGVRALRTMLPAVSARIADGSQVIVFPEGTRVDPGAVAAYQPGVAALYQRIEVPLVPVALNSGLCWGRGALNKRPGVITIAFLPPLPRGLSRDAFLAELADRIETATCRLSAGAGKPPSAAEARQEPTSEVEKESVPSAASARASDPAAET
jgi:1-acyl-sn-glycerol-3-phosphate acyltransferase